jgi:hypothetical protein
MDYSPRRRGARHRLGLDNFQGRFLASEVKFSLDANAAGIAHADSFTRVILG